MKMLHKVWKKLIWVWNKCQGYEKSAWWYETNDKCSETNTHLKDAHIVLLTDFFRTVFVWCGFVSYHCQWQYTFLYETDPFVCFFVFVVYNLKHTVHFSQPKWVKICIVCHWLHTTNGRVSYYWNFFYTSWYKKSFISTKPSNPLKNWAGRFENDRCKRGQARGACRGGRQHASGDVRCARPRDKATVISNPAWPRPAGAFRVATCQQGVPFASRPVNRARCLLQCTSPLARWRPHWAPHWPAVHPCAGNTRATHGPGAVPVPPKDKRVRSS